VSGEPCSDSTAAFIIARDSIFLDRSDGDLARVCRRSFGHECLLLQHVSYFPSEMAQAVQRDWQNREFVQGVQFNIMKIAGSCFAAALL